MAGKQRVNGGLCCLLLGDKVSQCCLFFGWQGESRCLLLKRESRHGVFEGGLDQKSNKTNENNRAIKENADRGQ